MFPDVSAKKSGTILIVEGIDWFDVSEQSRNSYLYSPLAVHGVLRRRG